MTYTPIEKENINVKALADATQYDLCIGDVVELSIFGLKVVGIITDIHNSGSDVLVRSYEDGMYIIRRKIFISQDGKFLREHDYEYVEISNLIKRSECVP